MNILIDGVDNIVKDRLGDVEINTDFRISILFEMLMQERKIGKKAKVIQALQLYYPDLSTIKNVDKAIEDMLWFYRCGKEVGKANAQREKRKQVYSYEFDDEYIYSAFMQEYGIDLDTCNLHWWKFKALLNGLSKNTKFVQIMEYRTMDTKSIKDKKVRKQYEHLQKIYKLPDMRTEEEKENDFANALL